MFCIDAALRDPVHNVETGFQLCLLLTASGNLFWNISDARKTTNLQFFWNHSYIRNDFKVLLVVK